MFSYHCTIINSQIRELAEKIGETPSFTNILVSTWQTLNKSQEIPSLEELKTYMKEREKELKERRFAIPLYSVREFKVTDPLARTSADNRISLVRFPENYTTKQALEHFFKYISGNLGKNETSAQKRKVLENIQTLKKEGKLQLSKDTILEELQDLIKSKRDIYTFLLWHEMSHVENNDTKVYWKNGKDLLTQDKIDIETRATLEALEKMKEFKKQNFSTSSTTTFSNQAIEYDREIQDIKAKAIANGTFMKAPNGKPTNLTERQWLQVRTKNFINWFGDWINDPANASKVVDENGEPLVVYHSNDAEEFDSTRQYNWFSSERQNYYGNHQYPVFLNIKNLFKRDDPTMEERAIVTDYGSGSEYDKLPKEYDGAMVYHNTFGYYEILTTKSSNQIKSATDNNGMFSAENDNIRMAIENTSNQKNSSGDNKARTAEQEKRIESWARKKGLWYNDYQEANKDVLPTPGVQPTKVNETNYRIKASKAFNAIERQNRVAMIAKDFSSVITRELEDTLDELEEQLAEAEGLEKANIQIKKDRYLDPIKGRRNFIEDITVQELFRILEEEYREYTDMSKEEAESNFGQRADYIQNAYSKVLDHWQALLEDAATEIENRESLRLIIEKHEYNTGTAKEQVVGGTIASSEEEKTQTEEQDEEDEERKAEGNDGFVKKARLVDPFSSLSPRIKRLLSNILRTDKKGRLIKDDLGKGKLLNPEYAHAILRNALSQMLESDDFCIKDGNNYKFPALEKLVKRYPWVQQIINELYTDNTLIGSFYANFRQDFIPYWTQIYGEDGSINTLHLNKPVAADSTMRALINNYEQGIVLSKNSLYDTNRNIDIENAEKGLDLIKKAQTYLLEGFEEEEQKIIVKNISSALEMVGIESNPKMIEALLSEEDGINNLEVTCECLGIIFSGAQKLKQGDNLINAFNQAFRGIAENIGEVNEATNVQSFRVDGKNRYSYSAPNFFTTFIKTFKNKNKYKVYAERHYLNKDWFIKQGDKKEYRNEMLRLLMTDANIRKNLDFKEMPILGTTPYEKWTPKDIKKAFMLEYFLADTQSEQETKWAYYNTPILADSPTALFFKFIKYQTDSQKSFIDKMLPLYRKLIMQELSRINLVKARRDNPAIKKIANFDDNGDKFHFIPELNNIKDFLNTLKNLSENKDTKALNNFLDDTIKDIMKAKVRAFKSETPQALIEVEKELLNKHIIIEDTQEAMDEQFNELIEEYVWNSTYFTSQIIQLTAVDLAYYKNDVDFQKRYKEIYAAGIKLNTNTKYGRKIERTIYFKDLKIKSAIFNDIKEVLDDAVKEQRLTSYDRDNILHKFEDINVTDAQAYRCIDSYRAVLDMMGAWTPQMEEAVQRFEANQWDMKDFNIVWQPIKDFMFTHTDKPDGFGGTLSVPHQNKNSEFLLLATYQVIANSLGKSSTLQAIEQWMKDNNVDVIQFESAVKSGCQGPIDINNTDDIIKTLDKYTKIDNAFNPEVVHELSYEDYIIQQATPEHLFDHVAIFGSQFRNLIVSDISKDAKFSINGKTYNKQELLNLYNSIIVENLLEDFEKVKGAFANIHELQAALLKSVKSSSTYSRDLLDALQIVEITDPETGQTKETFNIPLDVPTITNQIQQIVSSLFKNRITKQYIKGASCIQVSDFGLTKELQIVRDENGNLVGAECYLPAYAREMFEKLIDSKGNLDINKLPINLRKIIGYRIPTEDKYSMLPLIIKGFLPIQNGSSIMMPADITAIAGSDFDVDKMYLMIPEYYKDKEGNFKKIKYDASKSASEQSREARNNMLIDISYSILTNKDTLDKLFNPGNFDKAKIMARIANILKNKEIYETFAEEFNLSTEFEDIDSTATKILNIIKRQDLDSLDKFFKKYKTERDPLSLDTFIYFHNQNTTAGKLIGIYANNTSMQAKMQESSLGLKSDFVFTINGRKIQSLHDTYSPLGERISKNCAVFSNASVDAIKDPILADLMQTPDTANITCFMLRAGFSIEEIGLLFSQPLIRNEISRTGSLRNIDNSAKELVQKINGIYGEDLISYIDYTATDSNTLLKNILFDVTAKSDIPLNTLTDALQNQLNAVAFMSNIRTLAEQFNTLTHIARADSPNASLGITLAKGRNQRQAVSAYTGREGDKLFPFTGIKNIIHDGKVSAKMSRNQLRERLLQGDAPRLQAFYSLGIELALPLMDEYFGITSPYVDKLLSNVMDNSLDGNLSEKNIQKFYREFTYFALTKTNLFGNDGKKTFEEKRKYYIETFPKEFLRIKTANPEIANINIIKKLAVKQGKIIMENSGRMSPTMRDALKLDLESMLYSNDVTQHNLAIGLFKYSFYADKLLFGPSTFSTFFDSNFISSFPEFIDTFRNLKREATTGSFFDKFLPQYYANNYKSLRLKSFSGDESDIVLTDDGEAAINTKSVYNRNLLGREEFAPYEYIKINDTLYKMKFTDTNTTVYEKVNTFPLWGYDANMSTDTLYNLLLDRYKYLQKIQESKADIPLDELNSTEDIETIINRKELGVESTMDDSTVDNLQKMIDAVESDEEEMEISDEIMEMINKAERGETSQLDYDEFDSLDSLDEPLCD